MNRKRPVRLVIAAAASAALALFTAPLAHATATETPSWGAANLLSYADSDFEGGVGGWVEYGTNTTVAQDTTHAYLHSASLRLTATASGSLAAKDQMGGDEVPVTGRNTYRVSVWVKTGSAVTGRTVTFALGFYTAGGTWIGWTSGTANTLASSSGWQYVSETIAAPATAGYTEGSPRVTEAGVSASETLNLDEVLFEPYRAATLIGAEDTSGDCTAFSAANTAIGPLQSCKEFYDPTTAIPSSWTSSKNPCASLPTGTTCVLAYKDMASSTLLDDFISTVPSTSPVIFVFYQEPENPHDSFSYDGLTGAAAFVAEFENQAGIIHAAATTYSEPGVFVADDSMDYQYVAGESNDNGVSCSFIVPSSAGADAPDFYLDDHYAFTSNGDSLVDNSDSEAADEWDGWLSCVAPQNKPIGLAEYGVDCGQGSGTGSAPDSAYTSEEMASDNTYLAGEPDGLPVVLWEYWWNSNVGCQFTEGGSPDGTAAVTQWQANENQNGGGSV